MKIQAMKAIMVIAGAMILTAPAWGQCTTIQDGGLLDSNNDPISIGFDDWGYNYPGHVFNGLWCDAWRGATCSPGVEDAPLAEAADTDLIMKWNDTWLSNKDCDGDHKLDRPAGGTCSIASKGSGAWLTNQQTGYVDVNSRPRRWTYFLKIVSVPAGATLSGDKWVEGGIEIGPAIWGGCAIVQQVFNDPSNGNHGILYNSPAGPGLGHFD